MWTAAFWRGVVERMIRAIAAAELGLLVTGKADAVRAVHADAYLWVGVTAAAVSLLLSLVANGSGVGPNGSASMVFDRPRDDAPVGRGSAGGSVQ